MSVSMYVFGINMKRTAKKTGLFMSETPHSSKGNRLSYDSRKSDAGN